MILAPPLRFLLLLLVGWIGARVAILTIDASPRPIGRAIARPAAPAAISSIIEPARAARHTAGAYRPKPGRAAPSEAIVAWSPPMGPRQDAVPHRWSGPLALPPGATTGPEAAPVPERTTPNPAQAAEPPAARTRGWSLYAWVHLRDGRAPSIAPVGSLGRSQAGVRATYDLSPSVRAAARVSAPLDAAGAEIAAGVEWRPRPDWPVQLLAERRQALDRAGRSAFAAMVHGGVDAERLGPVEIEGYAQAGVVGLRSRDLFVDGSLAGGIPIGSALRAGGGMWAAAQPGAARLDVGPQLVARMPIGGGAVRVAAEWRFRIAGEAAPASGPALSVAAGF